MISNKFIEEELYKKIVEVMPIPTVDVMIFNLDFSKTLLFCRNNEPLKNSYYSLGGRLNMGESFFDCAKRKLKEEINFVVNLDELIQVGAISEYFIEENKKFHFVNVYFSLILNEDNNLKLDNQHSGFKWFDVNDTKIHKYIKEKIFNCIKNKK